MGSKGFLIRLLMPQANCPGIARFLVSKLG
jgi:hypothetical protein